MDLADPELADVVEEEIGDLVANSFLGGAPVIRVSATTGDGLDQLKSALRRLAESCTERPLDGEFRLPIDRVFVLDGTGTVVTGTAWSGAVKEGQDLRLLPGDRTIRVRGVQSHDSEVDSATAGSRVALALHGVKRDDVERGMQLVSGTAWRPSLRLGIEVTAVPDPELAAWLRPRARFHVHHAAREVLGRLDFLGDDNHLAPGQSAYARLVLEEELVARPGDRLVLRSYSPMHTVAGGVVLDPELPAGERRRQSHERLRALSTEPVEAWALPPTLSLGGRRVNECVARLSMLGHSKSQAAAMLREGEESGRLLRVGERLFHHEAIEALATAALEHLRRLQAKQPLSTGLPKEELRGAVGFAGSVSDFTRILGRLSERHPIFVLGDRVRADSESPELDEAARRALQTLEERIKDATPLYEASTEDLEAPFLRLLIARGRAEKLSGRLIAHVVLLDELRAKVISHFREADELEIAHMREWTQASRKFVVPLMEWLDAEDLTRFDGSVRRAGPVATRD
jgi:selenocysteine-specific elongation factor